MKAVILAAGEGTRLRPLTLETPKPLLEISGGKIIDRIFESLPDEIDEVIIVVEYLKEKIKSYVGSSFHNKKITYVDQIEMKGTYGALFSAKGLLTPDERFLVINGDDIHDKKELEKYLEHPRAFGLQKMIMPRYYNMTVDSRGYVEGSRAQTEDEKVSGVLVATGAYVLDSNIFAEDPVKVFGGEYGLPQTILKQKDKYPIKAVITEKWITINSLEDIKNASIFP